MWIEPQTSWSLAQCGEEINLGVPQCFRQSVVRKQEISSFLTKAGRHPSHITVRVTFVTVLVILVVVVIVLRVFIISVVVVYASVRAKLFFWFPRANACFKLGVRELECCCAPSHRARTARPWPLSEVGHHHSSFPSRHSRQLNPDQALARVPLAVPVTSSAARGIRPRVDGPSARSCRSSSWSFATGRSRSQHPGSHHDGRSLWARSP